LDRSLGWKVDKRLLWGCLRTGEHLQPAQKKIGFSYQKTKGKYPETDPKKQDVFKEDLKKVYESPADTVLLYEDEFSLSNTDILNYLWTEKGNRPIVI